MWTIPSLFRGRLLSIMVREMGFQQDRWMGCRLNQVFFVCTKLLCLCVVHTARSIMNENFSAVAMHSKCRENMKLQ